MILQLQPRIRVETPLGAGLALFFEDDGEEIYWTVALTGTRAIVQFLNNKIRIAPTYTDGTGPDDETMRKIISKTA
jgi:hypothetical protein